MERRQVPRTSERGSRSEQRSRTVHSILGAAMAITAREGIVGLSMSTIAEDAGVSRQTLYKYFADVDAVLLALSDMGNAGIADLAEQIDLEADPREALGLFVAAVLGSVASGHPSPRALTSALPASAREAMRVHEVEAQELVIGLLRRGCETHVFRDDLDPVVDGRFIYGATFAAAEMVLEPDMDTDALCARVTDDLLRMVEVR